MLITCILVNCYIFWRHRNVNWPLVLRNWKNWWSLLGNVCIIISIKLKVDIGINIWLGYWKIIYQPSILLLWSNISLTIISIVHYSILNNAFLKLSSYNRLRLSADRLSLEVYWSRLLGKNWSWVSGIYVIVLIIFNFCRGLRLIC
jgi:hypothetical protein